MQTKMDLFFCFASFWNWIEEGKGCYCIWFTVVLICLCASAAGSEIFKAASKCSRKLDFQCMKFLLTTKMAFGSPLLSYFSHVRLHIKPRHSNSIIEAFSTAQKRPKQSFYCWIPDRGLEYFVYKLALDIALVHTVVKFQFLPLSLCLKITQYVVFEFLNFGIFYQSLSY